MKVLMLSGKHEGRVIDHPLHIARRLLDAGVAQVVDDRRRVTDVEREYATPPATETPEAPAVALDDLSKAELVALAEERGVTVTRADGENGAPLKSDYVRALGG